MFCNNNSIITGWCLECAVSVCTTICEVKQQRKHKTPNILIMGFLSHTKRGSWTAWFTYAPRFQDWVVHVCLCVSLQGSGPPAGVQQLWTSHRWHLSGSADCEERPVLHRVPYTGATFQRQPSPAVHHGNNRWGCVDWMSALVGGACPVVTSDFTSC